MREFSLEEIKSICQAAALPVPDDFIQKRLEEYQEKYVGGYPYYAALRDVTAALKPETVVEIGTWEGTSAACFASGNPETRVITIDHHSDPGDHINLERTAEVAQRYPNLFYIQGCSTEMVAAQKPTSRFVYPNVVETLEGKTIDVLFIDGWHGGPYARADFDTYRNLLSPTALIICDDIYGDDCETLYGMKRFWEEMPGEKYLDPRIHQVYQMGFIKLVTP